MSSLVRLVRFAACYAGLLGVLLCACSGVPPVTGETGGAGGMGGGGTLVVSPPDQPCAFVVTPPTPTGNPSCPQGTYTGNLNIDGPEDIAALAGCTRIAGDLNIGGPTLQSVRGLEALRAVEGRVSLLVGALPCANPRDCIGLPRSPLLTSLRGLDELRCVGGDLGMLTTSPPLLDAGGLGKLSDVEGSLVVYSYGPLVQTLPALTRVYGDVNVPGPVVVPALTTVYGGVSTTAGPALPGTFPRLSYIGCGSSAVPCRDGVLGCDFNASDQSGAQSLSTCKYAMKNVTLSGAALTSSAPLRQLRQVRGVLTLEGTGLSDVSGLSDLERVGSLVITNNDALRDVNALDGVTVGYAGKPFPVVPEPNGAINGIGGLRLENNAKLTSLSWSNVRIGGTAATMGFELVANPALTNFGSLPWLTEVFRLRVRGSPLTSLAGLHALEAADVVQLADLPQLTTLTGLDNLERVKEFSLQNAGVTNVDALSSLGAAEDVQIGGCPALASVAGLRSITSLRAGLFLTDVPQLTSLRGLDALKDAQYVSITGAGLTDLTGLTSLESAYRILLHSCPRVASLAGLERLHELSEVDLTSLPVFTSFAALARVNTLSSLRVENLPALTSLMGINAPLHMSFVQLHRVPALRNLRGLDRATQIDALDIDDAGSLETLDGLGALEEVGLKFNLSRTGLYSLRALANLRYVNNGPSISGNPRLSDCELRWLFERIGYTASIEDLGLSNAGPRNCALTAPVTTPGLVWSRFFDRANAPIERVHLMPDNRLAVVGTVSGEPIFSPPPGTPQFPRPPVGSSAAWLSLLSPTGSALSTRLLSSFAGEYQGIMCSNVESSGRITIVAHEQFADGAAEIAEFRLASDGSLLAERRLPAVPESGCAIDTAGNLYLSSRTAAVLTKRGASGSVLWQKTIPVPAAVGDAYWASPQPTSSGVLLQISGAVTALVRVLDDGRVAWTRLLRGTLVDSVQMVMAPDGQVSVLGVAQSPVSTDDAPAELPVPATGDLPFLLRVRADGSTASLRAFPNPMAGGRTAFGPDGSLYVVSDGYSAAPFAPAALYKFDANGNQLFQRDLGPLLAGWTGSDQFSSRALTASADRVIVAAATAHTDGFLAQFAP